MRQTIQGGKRDTRSAFRVSSATVPRTVGSVALVNGMVVLGDISTPAQVGDIFRPETGVYAYQEFPIVAVTTNTFTIAANLNPLPTTSDTFYILRHTSALSDNTGAIVVVATQGPTQFVQNGSNVTVNEDTVTPANSRPFPTIGLSAATGALIEAPTSAQIGIVTETAPATDTASSGLNGRLQRIAQRLTSLIALIPASLGQKVSASSFAVVIASDQSAVPASQSGTWNITNVSGTVSLPTGASTAALQTTGNTSLASIDSKLTSPLATKDPVNANGSYAEITNLTTAAQTFTVPANAVGFLLEYPSLTTNTDNIRWKIGSAATISSGMRMEPGRDSGYIPCATNISVIAETASSQTVTVQWILSV